MGSRWWAGPVRPIAPALPAARLGEPSGSCSGAASTIWGSGGCGADEDSAGGAAGEETGCG
jgi:hypothetical protein